MLINNLYESWLQLAKEEASIDGYNPDDLDLWLKSMSNQSIFQGYLQHCIKKRRWAFELYFAVNIGGPSSAVKIIAGNSVFAERENTYWGQESPYPAIALFTAYLTALAEQRSPEEGEEWQNQSNGDIISVSYIFADGNDPSFKAPQVAGMNYGCLEIIPLKTFLGLSDGLLNFVKLNKNVYFPARQKPSL